MVDRELSSDTRNFKLTRLSFAGIGVVSLIYFADIFLKASHKCFWFDELFTVYLCRLPTFIGTWTAITHGADFNPPLFYLLTRASQSVFGEGLISTRLPATIGVWLFCVCIFLFVARRAGSVSGFIAGMFPFFTLAQYYAYEARAHGIVLGWCGLSLVCWQRCIEGRAKHLWLTGFALCLTGAMLTHVYAVYLILPFVFVEFCEFVSGRRPTWRIVAVIGVSVASVTYAVYLTLFRQYRAAAMPLSYFPASHDLFQRFLVDAIGPAIAVILISLVLSSLHWKQGSHPSEASSFTLREIILAAAFTCIPLVGLAGCKISHGPFLDRYFLSSMAGFAIFLGIASSRWQPASQGAKILAGFMLCLMLADLGATAYFIAFHRVRLNEPSTGLTLNTEPSNPMQMHEKLSADHSGLDILVLSSLEYIYFFYYCEPSIVSRLYFASSADDVNLGGYEKLARSTHTDLKLTRFAPFLASHEKFLVYGGTGGPDIDALQAFTAAGFTLISAQEDVGGVLYEYQRLRKEAR